MAEIDRTKFSYRHHSFMVFVDGVEIPWVFIQFRMQLDSPTMVEIHVEPDDLIERIRPKSYVHIFMSDPYLEETSVEGRPEKEFDRNSSFDKKRYFLCFEGELQGITESESAESRSMVLSCSDLFGVINNTSLELVQINQSIHLPMINGSTFYGSFTAPPGQNQSVLKYAIYAAMGFGDISTDADATTATREQQLANRTDQQFPTLRDGRKGSQSYFYYDAVRLALKYFIQFNSSYRLQATRTRLFYKMSGIADQTFQRFMERRVAQTLITNGFENVPFMTLGDLMRYMLAVGLHSYTSMLFPVLNDKATEGAWNQYLFLPNLYYALPPACNWIFPEHIQSLNASRFFSQEPTRIGVLDPMVGQFGLLHVAPNGLTDTLTGGDPPLDPRSNTGRRSPEAFFGSNPLVTANPRNEKDLDFLPFRITSEAENPTTNPNLLRLLSPLEIEKGVIYRASDISVEYFAGIHGTTNVLKGDSEFRREGAEKAKLDSAIQSLIVDQSDYIKYVQALTEYRLSIEQLNRDVTLAGPFNPWPVVGFPVVVCRQDRSYRGLLVGLNHTVGASGEAQTVYNLAYTTLFRPKAAGVGNLDADIRETVNKTKEAKRAAETAQKSSDDLKENLPEKSLEETPFKVTVDAKLQVRDLKSVSEAVQVLRSSTKNWRTDVDLSGVVQAINKFHDDIPTQVRNRVGSDIQDVSSFVGSLNTVVVDSKSLFSSKTIILPGQQYGESMSDYDRRHQSNLAEFFEPTTPETATYTMRVGSLLRLFDHILDYPRLATGAVTGITTAGIFSQSDYAFPTQGSPIELPATVYINEFNNKVFTVDYARSGLRDTKSYADLVSSPISVVSSTVVRRLSYALNRSSFLLGADTRESQGYFLLIVGPRTELSSYGERGETTTERWYFTDLDELVDGLIERVIRLAAETNDTDNLDAYSNGLTKKIDDLVKDRTRADLLALRARIDLNKLRSSVESLTESAPIMPFANPRLLDPATVEEEYQGVLGEADQLKSRDPSGLSSVFQQAADLDPRLLQGLATESFFRLSASIFAFDSESTRQTLYDNWERSGDVHKEVNRFGRRKNAVTLEDFLNRADLTLYEETARFGPFTRTFYRMSAGGGTGSYFDKILSNDNRVIGQADGDRDILQIRQDVYPERSNPALYEAARQEIILSYSRVHFVPRALRGK